MLAAAIAVIAFYFLILMGFTAMRTVLGLAVMFIPFYFIFDNFDLNHKEKIAFAFFTAIAIYPSLVYWIGFVTGFRMAIVVSFVLAMAVGYGVRRINGKKQNY